MLDELNDDVILRMIYFFRFSARDVILQAKPHAQKLYRQKLQKKYPSFAVKGMKGVLKMMSIKGIPMYESLYVTNPMPFGMGDIRNARHLRLPFDRYSVPGASSLRLSTLWDGILRGAIIFGSNIRYIEMAIGMAVIPGSRVYFKTKGNSTKEFLGYKFPLSFKSVDTWEEMTIQGLPLGNIFSSIFFQCNRSGKINKITVIRDQYQDEWKSKRMNDAIWEAPNGFTIFRDEPPYLEIF